MISRVVVCLTLTGMLLVGLALAGPGDDGPRVQVWGLSVTRPAPDGVTLGQAGTRLQLHVRLPGEQIIGLDKQRALESARFTDDKDTNFAPTSRFSRSLVGSDIQLSPDGQSLFVWIESSRLPADGASKLNLRGTLNVLVGLNPRTAVHKDLELVRGELMTAGPAEMKINAVHMVPWNDYAMQLILTSEQDISAIRSITFLGPDGKEIDSRKISSSNAGFMGTYSYTEHFVLARECKKVSVKVDYFDELKTVPVDMDITAGLGL